MKYLQDEPFSSGANSDAYRDGWSRIFEEPMKAVLKFDSPEEDFELKCAMNGHKWRGVVEDVLSFIRNEIKYAERDEEHVEAFEEVRDQIVESMEAYNLDLEDDCGF